MGGYRSSKFSSIFREDDRLRRPPSLQSAKCHHASLSSLLPIGNVWCVIFANVLLLAAAWSLIVRRSALVFSGGIMLSTITVRSVTLSARKYSSTMMGCAALMFTFLIGHLYSNTVMSSFLNPRVEIPSTLPVLGYDMHTWCYEEKTLNLILDPNIGLYRIQMLDTVKKPLRKFQPLRGYSLVNGFLHFQTVMIGPPEEGIRPLPLAPTQKSRVVDRIFHQGLISPSRLKIHEARSFLASRARGGRNKLWRENLNPVYIGAYRRLAGHPTKPLFEPVPYRPGAEMS